MLRNSAAISGFSAADIAAEKAFCGGLSRSSATGRDANQHERGISRTVGPPIAWFKDPAGNILAVLQVT
jgi:hypothetical protein